MDIKFITSESGDWIAMYINGMRVEEGHSINEKKVCKLISEHINSMTVHTYELSQERAESEGFPEEINEEYTENLLDERMIRALNP